MKINKFQQITSLSMLCSLVSLAQQKQPNVVFILADDLGYGDLSCYSQTKFSTPNIDKLAANGIKFTQHYSGCTVSAPSRSVLLTGLHTGHTPIRGNKNDSIYGQLPISDKTFTMAELFKKAGYATGCFGKWGLGATHNEGDPQKQGFDEFYGYYCQSDAHRYYPNSIWQNGKEISLNNNEKLNDYAPDFIQNQAIKFIENHSEKPFFLFLPYILPHAEFISPSDSILQKFQGKFLPEKSFQGNDYFNEKFTKNGYTSQDEIYATYASMIYRLDVYVGQIIAKLKQLGLDKNTLVVFTSDNGPCIEGGADPDFFNSNGSFSGYKRDLTDGGIRVPMIISWSKMQHKSLETNHLSYFADFFSTFAELTNQMTTTKTDGVSLLPTIIGKGVQNVNPYLYWEFQEQGGKQAIRMENWKAIRLNMSNNKDAEILLYDLNTDIEEKKNVAANYPEIVKTMKKIFAESHTKSENFKFEYEK